jgi:hypothetical protein
MDFPAMIPHTLQRHGITKMIPDVRNDSMEGQDEFFITIEVRIPSSRICFITTQSFQK